MPKPHSMLNLSGPPRSWCLALWALWAIGALTLGFLSGMSAVRSAGPVAPGSAAGSPNLRRAGANTSQLLPKSVVLAFQQVASDAHEDLVRGARIGAAPIMTWKAGSNFEAVRLSLPLAPPIIKHDPAAGNGDVNKNIVAINFLGTGGRKCVVYGMGIAEDSSFEEEMAQQGCETHAFDCTVDPKARVVTGKSFIFHPWCIGEQGEGFNQENVYARNAGAKAFQFKKLSEVMRILGHSSVDILKFDIEGFEWELFRTEILSLAAPPKQLAFELHTEGAYPGAVIPRLVQGKAYIQVNKLFLALYERGYRVASKELNDQDEKCAEFILVNVND